MYVNKMSEEPQEWLFFSYDVFFSLFSKYTVFHEGSGFFLFQAVYTVVILFLVLL